MGFEQPDNELVRLQELLLCKIDNDTPDKYFQDFASLALSVANTASTAIVFFADAQTWVKGEAGYKFLIDNRQDLLSGLLFENEDVIQIADTLKHDGLKSSMLLGDKPIIRFIGKIPIMSKNNIVLGAIYVLDDKPRLLTDTQMSSLSALSRIIESHLEFRKINGMQ